jgi:beta-lactamase superfamily II metal-dependent hydrolase
MALEAGARAIGAGQRAMLVPPSGVDAGAFYDLVEARAHGFSDNLLAIDKAANNTSVVIMLEWRGWRLLFAADAQLESWRTMDDKGVLKPVHYLKVSHHGSHNGTPAPSLLDKVLPLPRGGWKKGRAVISTWEGQYGGIPHEPTNEKLRARTRLHSTLDPGKRDALYIDSYFTA